MLGTHIELDLGIVSTILLDLPVLRGNGQQLPLAIIHELPLIVSYGLCAPPQSQVDFFHCPVRDKKNNKGNKRNKKNQATEKWKCNKKTAVNIYFLRVVASPFLLHSKRKSFCVDINFR